MFSCLFFPGNMISGLVSRVVRGRDARGGPCLWAPKRCQDAADTYRGHIQGIPTRFLIRIKSLFCVFRRLMGSFYMGGLHICMTNLSCVILVL